MPGPDLDQVVGRYEDDFPPEGHGLAQIIQRSEPVGVGVFPAVVSMETHIDRDYAIHLDP